MPNKIDRVALVAAGMLAAACTTAADANDTDAAESSSSAATTMPAGSEADAESTAGPATSVDTGTDPDDTGPAPTSAGSSGDDGGSTETGEPTPDGVPMFVAQGHAGRTTISCDDGLSWVAHQSDDDTLDCFDPYDCDHDAGAGRGIGYGDGWFVATFGWGTPGSVVRSRDGVAWEAVTTETSFGGIAFHDGVFLAGARNPLLSDDEAATWFDAGDTMMAQYNVRRVGAAPVDGGRFIMVATSGEENEVVLTSDAGVSWWHPSSIPAECGGAIQTRGGIVHGNGVLLIIGGNGDACTSTAGGDTGLSTPIGSGVDSHAVWDGENFVVWGGGSKHESADGVTWTATAIAPAGLNIGVVAVNEATGTIAAVRGGWQVWYEDQEFYRSIDGVTFDVLDPGQFTGSHPIRAMTFGYGESSDACPE